MKAKKFDAVQFMRQIRDKMNADMRDMTFEEQKRYIEQRASKVRQELESRHETTAHEMTSEELYPAKVVKTMQALLNRPGASPPALRQAALSRAEQLSEKAPSVEEIPGELTPYLDQVVRHAERTTEADIEQLKDRGYSEDQIFELTLCAALGAGLARLNRGLAALQGGE